MIIRIMRWEILRQCSACFLTLFLILPAAAQAQGMPSGKDSAPQAQNQNSGDKGTTAAPATDPEPLPDSPGSTRFLVVAQNQSSGDAPPAPAPPQDQIKKPLGTAAAGEVNATGIAASRPEGAALAPEKQRRVHRWVIKLGVVAAVGVALGATLALTAASPSKPPGAP